MKIKQNRTVIKKITFNRCVSFHDLWNMRWMLFLVVKRIIKPSIFFNLCNFVYSYFGKYSKVFNKPFYMLLEVSSRCNLNCKMCKRSLFDFNRAIRDMTFEEFKKNINRLGKYLVFIALWNYGEPLLNTELSKMIRYASDKKIITIVNTNGLLLDQNKAKEVLVSGLKYLIISLDGTDNDVYGEYRQGGNFSLLRDNVKQLCGIKKKLGVRFPIIELQFIVMQKNEHQAYNFFSLARNWGVDRASLKKFNTLVRFEQPEIFLPKNDLFVSDVFKGEANFIKNTCSAPWSGMVLNSDGNIVPCCSDFFSIRKMGNAFQEDINDIWNGEDYIKLRKEMNSTIHSPEICNDCPHTYGQEGDFISTVSL